MAKAQKIIIKKQRSKFTNLMLAFIRRFHLMLFFILVVALLAIGVIMLNQTLTETSPEDYVNQNTSPPTLNQAALDEIESLHTSADPSDPNLPSSGRINPFAE